MIHVYVEAAKNIRNAVESKSYDSSICVEYNEFVLRIKMGYSTKEGNLVRLRL